MRRAVQIACVVGVATLTGTAVWALFDSGSAVAVAVPGPVPGVVAAECATLSKDLPKSLLGQNRATTTPASTLTAAWQSDDSSQPAITLRCGVPEPSVLISGSADYDPTDEESYIDGIAWLMDPTSSGYQFIAAQRAAFIEVDVPSAYSLETMALPGLASAIIEAVPRADGGHGPDDDPDGN
jgi:Protein of unknown function (DUF3515)